MDLIIVTGLSGAGRRSVLAALEDHGYTAMDNVPARLLEPLIELEGRLYPGRTRLAVGMDGRHEDFASEFEPMLHRLRDSSQAIQIIFVEANDAVLLRRYSETRRVHHLARNGASVAEGIAKERALLAPIRAEATAILDTSDMSLAEMRQRLEQLLPGAVAQDIRVRLISFGYKFGIPHDADVVLDARFLPNPYYLTQLRDLTGQDEAVQRWLLESGAFGEFLQKAEAWLRWSLPLLRHEGRAYHTLAIGCTGGQHRSVALVELLAGRLKHDLPELQVRHREVPA
ncbi:MAG TPA: RNase adapter RapZ [Holophagaceae bacterium]|nr:RNase adapter RapZ [Holophagaceae bacterium]